MYRNLIALLALPLFGLLLGGIVGQAVAAEPLADPFAVLELSSEDDVARAAELPLVAIPAREQAGSYLGSDFSLQRAPLSTGCCMAVGGPYEPAAADVFEAAERTVYRWETLIDRRIEQRLRLPTFTPLDGFIVRF